MNMNPKKRRIRKLRILQLFTSISMIVLVLIYERWFGPGFEFLLTGIFAFFVFLPDFYRWFHKIPYEEVRPTIIVFLAFMWSYSFFNILRIVEDMYEKDLGISLYVASLIPILVLVYYVARFEEWREFFKSLIRKHDRYAE